MLDIPCVLWVYLEMPHLTLHTWIPHKKVFNCSKLCNLCINGLQFVNNKTVMKTKGRCFLPNCFTALLVAHSRIWYNCSSIKLAHQYVQYPGEKEKDLTRIQKIQSQILAGSQSLLFCAFLHVVCMLHLYTPPYSNVWQMHHLVLNGLLSTKELKSTTKRDTPHKLSWQQGSENAS